MKRIFAISVLLNLAFVVGLMWKEMLVHAWSGGGIPIGNGDVNGDGMIDISDVAYLVNALFLGGPDLKAIECPPPATGNLPSSGQMMTYGDCAGQDGSYQAGCLSEGRFIDNKDGTVTDTCAGLMWQEDTADVNGDGVIDNNDVLHWCDALTYCENLRLAGHDNWRLPNVRELQSIVDYGRINPSIDPVLGALPAGYWSSTSIVAVLNPWFVDFYSGVVIGDFNVGSRAISLCVRAVRS